MGEVEFRIRSMTADDWPAVKSIYRQGIETGIATFETKVPEWKDWDKSHLAHSRIIAENDKEITGWAALSSVSDRCVYGGVAEVSVYVAASACCKGVGKRLLKALIETSKENGIWTLQAGIIAENDASIILHKKCGFRIVGRREKLGCLHGIWKDVMLMERRSDTVGVS